jgi:Holliday junction DNA helicase RuvB
MNVAPDTLVDEVEPYLLRSEFVVRTPRGRKLTPKGVDHIGLTQPDPQSDNEQRRLFD